MSKLEATIAASAKLMSPAAPGVLTLLASPQPELEKLRVAIEVDPALTVKAIHLANGGYYGRQVPVASLRRALVRLGWKASCELLTRLIVQSACEQVDPGLGRPIWEHSLNMGLVTRILAKSARVVDPSLAYTTGLVHSIGQLGLAAIYQNRYAATWHAAPSGAHLAARERQDLGFDHAHIASGVLAPLHLPEEIPTSVRWMYRARLHEQEWFGHRELPLAACLQLADQLLARDGRRLGDRAWLSRHPLAHALHLSEELDVRGALDKALQVNQSAAA